MILTRSTRNRSSWSSCPISGRRRFTRSQQNAATKTRFRVFPGEGGHSDAVAAFVGKLDALGYAGIYSFDVYNDDYQQMPPDIVVNRARRAAEWLEETVLRRALPVPNMEHLRRTAED